MRDFRVGFETWMRFRAALWIITPKANYPRWLGNSSFVVSNNLFLFRYYLCKWNSLIIAYRPRYLESCIGHNKYCIACKLLVCDYSNNSWGRCKKEKAVQTLNNTEHFPFFILHFSITPHPTPNGQCRPKLTYIFRRLFAPHRILECCWSLY